MKLICTVPAAGVEMMQTWRLSDGRSACVGSTPQRLASSFAHIETALEGLTEDDLNFRGGPNGWSIRETVHHLVESNLVACTIVIAAVGTGGCTYDCSWLNPDRAWMERMGYTVGRWLRPSRCCQQCAAM